MSVDEPVKQVLTDEKKLEKRAEYLEFYRAGIKNPGWQAWSSEIGTFLSYRGYSGEISPLREVRNAKRHIVRRHQAKLYLGGVGILKFESKKVADAQRIIENAIVARLMKPVRAALPLRELKTR